MKNWWKHKAYPWLKKNWWKVLIFPVGLLLLAARIFGRTKLEVVPSEMAGASKVESDANKKADQRKVEVAEKRTQQVEEIKKDHEEVVKALTDEQKAKVAELLEDPEELNSYLHSISNQVRDGSKRPG